MIHECLFKWSMEGTNWLSVPGAIIPAWLIKHNEFHVYYFKSLKRDSLVTGTGMSQRWKGFGWELVAAFRWICKGGGSDPGERRWRFFVTRFGVTSIVPQHSSQHMLRQILLNKTTPEGLQMILSSPVLSYNTPRDFWSWQRWNASLFDSELKGKIAFVGYFYFLFALANSFRLQQL